MARISILLLVLSTSGCLELDKMGPTPEESRLREKRPSTLSTCYDGTAIHSEVMAGTYFPVNPLSTFTFSFWIKATSANPQGSPIASTLADHFYFFWSATPSQMSFGVLNNSIDARVDHQFANPTQWNLVTGVFNVQTATLYVNGVKIGEATTSANPITMGKFQISHAMNPLNNSCLDNVIVWKEALTADQVQSLYNARHESELPQDLPTPLSFWRMGEDGYAPIIDLQGRKNLSLDAGATVPLSNGAPTDRAYQTVAPDAGYDGELGPMPDSGEDGLINP